MPTYIGLFKWTAQGVANVKDSPNRLDAGRKEFEKIGVKLRDTWLTMGRYDLVCVIEAADDDTYARAMIGAVLRNRYLPLRRISGATFCTWPVRLSNRVALPP